jgi:hypothetical protein
MTHRRFDEAVESSSSIRAPTLAGSGDGAAADWQWRLSKDRPVYACPKCGQHALQFYALFPGIPEWEEVFRCHACQSCWEI